MLMVLIHDFDREIQVDLWCARIPPVVLGKFMVSPALALLDASWIRSPPCSPVPLPTSPGSEMSSAGTSTMSTVWIQLVLTDPLCWITKYGTKAECIAGFHLLSSLCSIWLWRGKGLKWHRRHRVLYGLPWQLQQQSQLPVEHPGAPRQTGPPPFPQFLSGGESDVHDWQGQPHRQNRKSRYVNICFLFRSSWLYIFWVILDVITLLYVTPHLPVSNTLTAVC